MKKLLQRITAITTSSALALLGVAPAFAVAAQPCDIVPPGHLISPGWLKKNVAPTVPDCQTLPPGISKKLNNPPGPPSGGNGDHTAPIISNVAASSITNAGAHITWTTNEPATSKVLFGTTNPVTDINGTVVQNASLITNHDLTLTGLAASTTYFFIVSSIDGAGNASVALQASFTTSAAPDTTAPVISAIATNSITSSGAHVTWTTNESASSKVFYSTSSPVNLATAAMVQNAALVTSHDLTLTGLAASTTYFYVVQSADGAGNVATGSEGSFATTAAPDTTGPVISAIVVDNISNTGARVNWTTNESSDSRVLYGTISPVTAINGTLVSQGSMVTSHSITLSGLSASTTYFFVVSSTDGSANMSGSIEASFTTLATPDTTAPIISAVASASTTINSSHVTWTTNESASSKVFYSTSSPVNLATAPVVINASLVTSHDLTLTGLAASTTYFYVVQSADGAGNTATSSEASLTTIAAPDTTAPVLTSVNATSTTSNSTHITWTTNEVSTSAVLYGTVSPVTAINGTLISQGALTTSHDLLITGLSASTTYFFIVSSTDGSANTGGTVESSFTTVP